MFSFLVYMSTFSISPLNVSGSYSQYSNGTDIGLSSSGSYSSSSGINTCSFNMSSNFFNPLPSLGLPNYMNR